MGSVKHKQDYIPDDIILPLTATYRIVATQGKDKAKLMATHFTSKMSVPDPARTPPKIPAFRMAALTNLIISKKERQQLQRKASTKNNSSPSS